MRAGDFWNLLQAFGPGDLRKEIKSVNHMRLDFKALGRVEAALGNRKQFDFPGVQVRALDAARIEERLLGDFAQLLKLMLLEQSRLVRFNYELKIFLDTFEALVEILTQTRDLGKSVAAIVLQVHLKLAPHVAGFRFLADVIKALAQNVELKRIQFFCFNQNFFAHTDFSEIVKQSSVANLFQLFGVKKGPGIGSGRRRVHGCGQALSVGGHTQGMARGSRVPLLNRGDSGADETF